jgi:hypothetical protein
VTEKTSVVVGFYLQLRIQSKPSHLILPKRVLVRVYYRPPNIDAEFLQEFNCFVKSVVDSQLKDIIIIGDFNYPSAHWLNGSGFSDSTTNSGFFDVLQEAGLFQLVNSPIQNCLDLLFTMNEYLIDNITVADDDSVCWKSDHKAITIDINLNRKVKKSVKCMGYNYKKGDFNSLCATLTCLPLLDIVEKESDINTAWAKWKDLFLAAFDSFIRKSNVKRSYKPPYITQVIIHALNMKKMLRKRAKSTNSPHIWERF